jgi:hypothetical protein
LDASLKEEFNIFDMTKVELRSHPYRPQKEKTVSISSDTYMPQSGCMQVELQYLWSGHLGDATPTQEQSAFDTAYINRGTKEINLVVVSPTGIIDRNIDFVDAY